MSNFLEHIFGREKPQVAAKEPSNVPSTVEEEPVLNSKEFIEKLPGILREQIRATELSVDKQAILLAEEMEIDHDGPNVDWNRIVEKQYEDDRAAAAKKLGLAPEATWEEIERERAVLHVTGYLLARALEDVGTDCFRGSYNYKRRKFELSVSDLRRVEKMLGIDKMSEKQRRDLGDNNDEAQIRKRALELFSRVVSDKVRSKLE